MAASSEQDESFDDVALLKTSTTTSTVHKSDTTTNASSSSSSSSSPLRLRIQRQLLYAICLLVALIIVQHGTSTIVWNVVQQHEPSIRIFRALLEIVVLLLCTAASIAVWTKYISIPITAQLLFMPVDSSIPPKTFTAVDEHDGESVNMFQDIHEQDLLHVDNDDGDDKDKITERIKHFTTTAAVPDRSRIRQSDKVESNVENDDEACSIPNPLGLVSAALELLIWILIALVLYTITAAEAVQLYLSDTTSIDDSSSSPRSNPILHGLARIAAPTFPLILFVGAAVKAFYPWKIRRQFYYIVSYTLSAPGYDVSFRDGMIGDVLTSMVRPMQDVAFTVFYIMFGLQGWWSNSYFSLTAPKAVNMGQLMGTNVTDAISNSFLHAADANVPAMERWWLLHTAILPACMISPLWWRFLQTLRQTYDYRQRWPYLGNAFKYFLAAQVAMIGVYQPRMQRSPIWLISFVLATLYQIYWDVFLDWGLLVRNRENGLWELRSQRLYPSRRLYWSLLVANSLLRFCWTLSFVPLRYLSAAGVLTSNFSSHNWTSIISPTIAAAEIIRRALWGLLRVEWEAIKTKGESASQNGIEMDSAEVEMSPMAAMQIGGAGGGSSLDRFALPVFTSDMTYMSNIQVVRELCFYTTTFAVLGIIIAAHRETL